MICLEAIWNTCPFVKLCPFASWAWLDDTANSKIDLYSRSSMRGEHSGAYLVSLKLILVCLIRKVLTTTSRWLSFEPSNELANRATQRDYNVVRPTRCLNSELRGTTTKTGFIYLSTQNGFPFNREACPVTTLVLMFCSTLWVNSHKLGIRYAVLWVDRSLDRKREIGDPHFLMRICCIWSGARHLLSSMSRQSFDIPC